MGVSRKWYHPIIDLFWHPNPFLQALYINSLSTVVTKSSLEAVTSYMDDPLPRTRSKTYTIDPWKKTSTKTSRRKHKKVFNTDHTFVRKRRNFFLSSNNLCNSGHVQRYLFNRSPYSFLLRVEKYFNKAIKSFNEIQGALHIRRFHFTSKDFEYFSICHF